MKNSANKELLSVLIIVLIGMFAGCVAPVVEKVDVNPVDILDRVESGEAAIDPEELLAASEYHIGRHEYDQALTLLHNVIINVSGNEQSDKAYYLRGVAFVSLLNYNRDLEKAAAAFRMVIALAPETVYDRMALIELEKLK